MKLLDITALAHPAGNRIDLAWTNPNPLQFPDVQVVRREGTHPTSSNDGVIVAHPPGSSSAADRGLKGETTYYYALFPFRTGPLQFDIDLRNRVSATASAPYGFGEQMAGLLPAIYHRYDAERTPAAGSAVAAQDADKGQLLRFLDLPGAQLDQLYSLARAMLSFYNLERVDGRLLPLLAQWIGWQSDFSLEVGAQRNEIRFAPHYFQTTGLIPTVEATVKRITGWESRTKEFVHNVARANQPERLNLWSALRDPGGNWGTPALASVNWVYEGRPSAVTEADSSLTFFYNTYRRHGWDIWSKQFAGGAWQPSQPVVDQPGIDKHPSAALQGAKLWLFWESYDPTQPEADQKWRINFRTRTGGVWSPASLFRDASDAAIERRLPSAAVDSSNGLWLFWLERVGPGWAVKYNRHNGVDWQLATPASLPLDGGLDPGVEDDLIVFTHPTSVNQRLWLFWVRREPGGPPGQSRWTIAYRIKSRLNPANDSDWSQVRLLPKASPADHHREPAPRLAAGGNIELFWSSNQDGGWSIWNSVLDINTFNLAAAQQVTASVFSERAPLAMSSGANTLLVYRSNQSLEYSSAVYSATTTLDLRAAGATTADTRNAAKLALRGKFEDFSAYTYDAGHDGVRTNADRIARDTIGLYLTPNIVNPDQIKTAISRLSNVLDEFMPITERAVFITP